MRLASLLAVGLVCGSLGAATADHAPVLVVPGRPGVPVVINGYDASYTVVEGDWGLSRPGHVPPVIVGGPLLRPAPYHSGAYYPSLGRRPGYGRREIEPPQDRRMLRPAPSYYREWGTQSQSLPANVDPPFNPPPVISGSPSDAQGGGGQVQDGQDNQQDRRNDRHAGKHRRDDRDHRRHHSDNHHDHRNRNHRQHNHHRHRNSQRRHGGHGRR